jgi:ABC-2 type transport system ATP-binding protein
MKDSVRRHAQEGAAIIVSSHLLSLVEDLCTSLLVLHRGEQRLHAPLAELRRQLTGDGKQETLEEVFFRLTGSPQPSETLEKSSEPLEK